MSLILGFLWMSCILRLAQTKVIETETEKELSETTCDGAIRELTVGTKSLELSFPAHPHLYPNQTTCLWRLVTRAGSRINITALSMDIEYIPSCSFDYLKIFDGENDTAPVLGTFCGKQLFSAVTSSHKALVVFHSDISYSGFGFRLEYNKTKSPAKGTEDGTNGVSNECNTTRREGPGYILSPDYPLPYPSDLWCQYVIHAPEGEKVELEFRDFALERNNACSADNLTVVQQDGSQQHFCGRKIPQRILSEGTQLTIIFQSDSILAFRGFNLSYSFVSANTSQKQDANDKLLDGGDPDCSFVRTDDPSVVSSPRYPHMYPRLKSCITVFKAPKKHRVILDFTSFQLENSSKCETDFLTIYDGMTEASAMLGKYCARELADATVKSSDRGLRLHFRSDYSIQEPGFNASYRFLSPDDDDGDDVCDMDCKHGGKCVKDRDGEY